MIQADLKDRLRECRVLVGHNRPAAKLTAPGGRERPPGLQSHPAQHHGGNPPYRSPTPSAPLFCTCCCYYLKITLRKFDHARYNECVMAQEEILQVRSESEHHALELETLANHLQHKVCAISAWLTA
jgi:hypothetical protein